MNIPRPLKFFKARARRFIQSAVRETFPISGRDSDLFEVLEDIRTSLRRLHSSVMMTDSAIGLYRYRLELVRRSPEFQSAFDTDNPLVSIIVPTHRAPNVMWTRTLPSLLNQTHDNLEILIAIDGNAPGIHVEIARQVDSFGDKRIRVVLSPPTPKKFPELRYADASDVEQFAWFSSGNGPYNFASDVAAGHWISPFSHDDELDPDAIERVLNHVRAQRLEYCYAPMRRLDPRGETTLNFSFPPEMYQFGVQGSLLHSHLRFFKYEYRDAALGIPNDWGIVRTMMLSGVRVGAYELPVSNYYPSQLFPND